MIKRSCAFFYSGKNSIFLNLFIYLVEGVVGRIVLKHIKNKTAETNTYI